MFGRKKKEPEGVIVNGRLDTRPGVFQVSVTSTYMVLPEYMEEAERYFGDLEPEIFDEWVKKVHGLRLERSRTWKGDRWCW